MGDFRKEKDAISLTEDVRFLLCRGGVDGPANSGEAGDIVAVNSPPVCELLMDEEEWVLMECECAFNAGPMDEDGLLSGTGGEARKWRGAKSKRNRVAGLAKLGTITGICICLQITPDGVDDNSTRGRPVNVGWQCPRVAT